MATDSSQAGYLAPSDALPPYDLALENIFQGVLVGITGIAGNLVRPRWQPEPPNQPDFATNWVAMGVQIMGTQWDAYQVHDPTLGPNGANVVEGTEVIHVTYSFYGPDYQANDHRLRAGMQIEQNRDALTTAKIKFIQFLDPVPLPALLKERWVKRLDTKAIFHRWVRRVYPILNLASASGSINNEHYLTPINVTNP